MARGIGANVMQISFRGEMPIGVWSKWREGTLDDIGKASVRLIRSSAPAGYARLRDAVTYRIVNASGRKDRNGTRIDLRPRIDGGRVHPLYHIAEGGRGVSIAGWNKTKAKSGAGRTGRNVLAMNIGGRMVFRPMAKGYRGTRFLKRAITGPIYTQGAQIVVSNLEKHALETKRVNL